MQLMSTVWKRYFFFCQVLSVSFLLSCWHLKLLYIYVAMKIKFNLNFLQNNCKELNGTFPAASVDYFISNLPIFLAASLTFSWHYFFQVLCPTTSKILWFSFVNRVHVNFFPPNFSSTGDFLDVILIFSQPFIWAGFFVASNFCAGVSFKHESLCILENAHYASQVFVSYICFLVNSPTVALLKISGKHLNLLNIY